MKAFDFTRTLLTSFYAFNDFTGGVTLPRATTTAPAETTSSSPPQVVHHDLGVCATQTLLASASSPIPTSQAASYVGGRPSQMSDGRGDPRRSATGNGQVLMYAGGTGEFITSFDPGFTGTVNGLRIGIGDVNNDSKPDILDGPVRARTRLSAYNALLTELGSLIAFDGFSGGGPIG